jgi:plastocyanin
MTKTSSLCGALLLVGAILTACSSVADAPNTTYGSSGSPVAVTGESAESPTPSGPTINISGMAFGGPLTVTPGATITIVNEDSMEHSVTSTPDAGFSTDVDGGERRTFTAPTQPGDYPFICKYHPSMKGVLTVK